MPRSPGRRFEGDADAAFKTADYIRRETFKVQRHAAMFMEPRGFVAEWNEAAGKLTVWGAAKTAWYNRRVLAAALGLEVEAVDLIEVDVGGGFGSRGEFYPEDYLIPAAAQDRRPSGEMDRRSPRAYDERQPRA